MITACHQPVLVSEVLSALVRRADVDAVYLDCTVGMGGHAEAILKVTTPYGKVIGFDRDAEALAFAKERLSVFEGRVQLYQSSLCNLSETAHRLHLSGVAGILFDLGVSSLQLTSAARGFSFATPGPLDMRMDPELPKTAADLVNTLPEKEIADLIFTYGEEKMARSIARAIIRFRREEGPITTTEGLSRLVCRVVRKPSRWTRLHPATKTFQALRMAVNDEEGQLTEGLSQAMGLLAVGGRLAVISFHSLEDRIVKRHFKAAAMAQTPPVRGASRVGSPFINLSKKPIIPTVAEITRNRSARSAKLRVLERVA